MHMQSGAAWRRGSGGWAAPREVLCRFVCVCVCAVHPFSAPLSPLIGKFRVSVCDQVLLPGICQGV